MGISGRLTEEEDSEGLVAMKSSIVGADDLG
jgi:hypothetical protein